MPSCCPAPPVSSRLAVVPPIRCRHARCRGVLSNPLHESPNSRSFMSFCRPDRHGDVSGITHDMMLSLDCQSSDRVSFNLCRKNLIVLNLCYFVNLNCFESDFRTCNALATDV